MLTKERTSKTRKLKYAAVALALIAVLLFCFASCGKATPTSVEYVTGTAQKSEYNLNETFDCTGAQIKVTYDNGAVETKDVTAAMVGNAPLTLGTTEVSVTYSENGATVIGYIPVVVKDPYSADKEAAVAGLYENETVKANPTDKGITALIVTYTEKINAATSKDVITIEVGKFADDLAKYVADKKAVLDAVEAVDISKLYDQYALQVNSLKVVAIANIKAASTIKEAEELLASYKTAVANAEAEQKVFEGDGQGQAGMINDKITILGDINYYEDRIANYKEWITEAFANGEIQQAALDENMGKYNRALDRLEWWYEYVTLAISLRGVRDTIEDEIEQLIKTPIDDIADILAKGVTVYPAPYKTTGTDTYALDLDNDVTGKLLAQIDTLYGQSETLFGATMTNRLYTQYGKHSDIDLSLIYDAIDTKYDDLTDKQTNATTPDNIIALITTAKNTAEGQAKMDAIEAAWEALYIWGATESVFTIDTSSQKIDRILYTTTYAANYSVELTNGKWTYDAGEWSETDAAGAVYTFTKDYVKTYFIPNLDELTEATIVQVVSMVKDAAAGIPEVILSYTDENADAGDEIEYAEMMLEAFVEEFGQAEYDKRFVVDGVDETKKTVTDARTAYTNLETLAKAANDKIVAYSALVENNADNVKRSHYSAEGALKIAYIAYKTFAEANTNEAGTIYTDVIEYSDETTVSGNESDLEAYMDAYVRIAYAEERKIETGTIIYNARNAKLATISLDDTDFRTAVSDYAAALHYDLSHDTAHEYSENAIVGEAKTMFNYDAMLEANLEIVRDAARDAVQVIEDATSAGDLVTP